MKYLVLTLLIPLVLQNAFAQDSGYGTAEQICWEAAPSGSAVCLESDTVSMYVPDPVRASLYEETLFTIIVDIVRTGNLSDATFADISISTSDGLSGWGRQIALADKPETFSEEFVVPTNAVEGKYSVKLKIYTGEHELGTPWEDEPIYLIEESFILTHLTAEQEQERKEAEALMQRARENFYPDPKYPTFFNITIKDENTNQLIEPPIALMVHECLVMTSSSQTVFCGNNSFPPEKRFVVTLDSNPQLVHVPWSPDYKPIGTIYTIDVNIDGYRESTWQYKVAPNANQGQIFALDIRLSPLPNVVRSLAEATADSANSFLPIVGGDFGGSTWWLWFSIMLMIGIATTSIFGAGPITRTWFSVLPPTVLFFNKLNGVGLPLGWLLLTVPPAVTIFCWLYTREPVHHTMYDYQPTLGGVGPTIGGGPAYADAIPMQIRQKEGYLYCLKCNQWILLSEFPENTSYSAIMIAKYHWDQQQPDGHSSPHPYEYRSLEQYRRAHQPRPKSKDEKLEDKFKSL